MKKVIVSALAVSLVLASCNKGEETTNSSTFSGLNSTADSVSYFIGSSVAQNLKKGGLDKSFSEAAFIEGLQNEFNGDSILLDPQVGGAIANRLAQQNQQSQFADKIKAGEDFLNAKSQEDGVVTLPSGLRYRVLKEGTGAKPTATNTVTTHYHGTLIDGTVFDSSVERGEPAKFPVNGVIPAWIEALQLMPVGSKWELYCPSTIAYGERGAGGAIGPYETLIFQVELLSIDN
jgi:FKBP-type peptidyl-prolyl cis-trans isomerase FklB